MAKQRRIQYPSSPTSFFDEMEREVNHTKRKSRKKASAIPPEKLFLQFDPSKNDIKVARSEATNKPHWKPPVKVLSQNESLELSKIIGLKENNPSNCLEENRSENVQYDDIEEGTAEIITIHSSAESSKHNSQQTPLSDNSEEVYSQNEKPHIKTKENIVLENKIETENSECEKLVTCNQKGSMVIAVNLSQKLAPYFDCNMETKIHSISNINQSTGQDINAIKKEEESTVVRVDKILNRSDENNLILINEVLEEEKLSPKENYILNENQNPKIVLLDHDPNIQISQCIENVGSSIAEGKPLETNFRTTTEKVDEPNSANYNEAECETKLLLKDDSVKEVLDINNEEKNKALTGSKEKENCENVEMNIDCRLNCLVSKSNVGETIKIFGESDIITKDTLRKPDIVCKLESLKKNTDNIQGLDENDQTGTKKSNNENSRENQFAQNVDETIKVNFDSGLHSFSSKKGSNTIVKDTKSGISNITTEKIATKLNDLREIESLKNNSDKSHAFNEITKDGTEKSDDLNPTKYQCTHNAEETIEMNVDCCLHCLVGKSGSNMADEIEKLGILDEITEKTVTKPDIEILKNNTDNIHGFNEITDIDYDRSDSVNLRENLFTQEAKEAIDLKGELLGSSLPELAKTKKSLLEGIERSINATADLITDSIITTNNDHNHSEQKNINTIANENEGSGNKTNVDTEGKLLIEGQSAHLNDTREQDRTQNEQVEEDNNESNHEIEQLLEEEKVLQKENIGLEEEYSCLMISDSQLEEIEKNYYKTSQRTTKTNILTAADENCAQSNQLRPKLVSIENKINLNRCEVEDKGERENVNSPQTKSTSLNSSDITVQKIQSKLPSVQWPKDVLEMQRNIRDLTGEVNRLNSLLMEFRRQIWPQKHGGDTSA